MDFSSFPRGPRRPGPPPPGRTARRSRAGPPGPSGGPARRPVCGPRARPGRRPRRRPPARPGRGWPSPSRRGRTRTPSGRRRDLGIECFAVRDGPGGGRQQNEDGGQAGGAFMAQVSDGFPERRRRTNMNLTCRGGEGGLNVATPWYRRGPVRRRVRRLASHAVASGQSWAGSGAVGEPDPAAPQQPQGFRADVAAAAGGPHDPGEPRADGPVEAVKEPDGLPVLEGGRDLAGDEEPVPVGAPAVKEDIRGVPPRLRLVLGPARPLVLVELQGGSGREYEVAVVPLAAVPGGAQVRDVPSGLVRRRLRGVVVPPADVQQRRPPSSAREGRGNPASWRRNRRNDSSTFPAAERPCSAAGVARDAMRPRMLHATPAGCGGWSGVCRRSYERAHATGHTIMLLSE